MIVVIEPEMIAVRICGIEVIAFEWLTSEAATRMAALSKKNLHQFIALLFAFFFDVQ